MLHIKTTKDCFPVIQLSSNHYPFRKDKQKIDEQIKAIIPVPNHDKRYTSKERLNLQDIMAIWKCQNQLIPKNKITVYFLTTQRMTDSQEGKKTIKSNMNKKGASFRHYWASTAPWVLIMKWLSSIDNSRTEDDIIHST